jgi:hypothetical protein
LRTHIKHTLVITLLAATAHSNAGQDPVIHELGWSLENNFAIFEPISAILDPETDGYFIGGRPSSNAPTKVYFTDPFGNILLNYGSTPVGGLEYVPSLGRLFSSHDWEGRVYGYDVNDSFRRDLWKEISGFFGEDRDPVGMTFISDNYTGTLLTPGEIITTDRGYNGPNGVYTWSAQEPRNGILTKVLHNTPDLFDPVDIAVKGSRIAVADSAGGIKLINDDASVSQLEPVNITFTNVQALAFDSFSADLFILDADLDSAYRVSPGGSATILISDLGISNRNWGGINIQNDGDSQRVVITSAENDRVYTFVNTPPCSLADLGEPFGQIDFFDVSAFLAAYIAQDPMVDFDNDGMSSFFDVSVFLNYYNNGCP